MDSNIFRCDLHKILELQILDLDKKLLHLGAKVDLSDAAKTFILMQADSKNYGARPIRRKIKLLVENEVASLIIAKKISQGSIIKIDSDGKKLKFSLHK